MRTFTVGSRCFFSTMPNFKERDKDILLILDEWPRELGFEPLGVRLNGCDVFMQKQKTKDEYIAQTLADHRIVYMFLVPEIAEYIGLSIADLKKIEPAIKSLEHTRHAWYITVFESYLQNGGFFLTNEQRSAAYEIYKIARTRTRKP